jgi:light-regulated signal transduction histidine kinase (bacteriophytochrome)
MIPDQRFLAQCETEALHLSCAIQRHGTLLVAADDGTVSQVAANIHEFIGPLPETWIGQCLPPKLHELASSLENRPGSRASDIFEVADTNRRLDVVATRGTDGCTIIELTEHPEAPPAATRPKVLLTERVPNDEEAMQAARSALTERIADLTGFQRVMYYQFRDDGDGEIIAEARRGEAYGSYLGLRYPASDIPQIARALYLKNPWRMIPDATAAPIPILCQTPAVPDLTYSDLRSVSPVHRAYLANMDVCASLSFPIEQGGTLDALIAAHHRESRLLPLNVLEHCAAVVRNHVLTLRRFQAQESMKSIDRLDHRMRDLRPLLYSPAQVLANWDELGRWLIHEFQADGAQLCLGDIHLRFGQCGDAATRTALEDWFGRVHAGPVSHTDSLSGQTACATGDEVAGALALRVNAPAMGELRLYLTRQEYIHEVAWGGNPEKPIEYGEDKNAISPRRSFEKWVEKRKGYCRSWNRMDHLLGLSLRNFLDREFKTPRRPIP